MTQILEQTQTTTNKTSPKEELEGLLLVDKPKGQSSFSLVAALRRVTGVKKIGHAGTLDPLATGVMVLLVGRKYTRLSDTFLSHDKEYIAEVRLGIRTSTYDAEGEILSETEDLPSREEIDAAIAQFQGKVKQVPPMYSAKKVNGQKLYDLARKGQTIDRRAEEVELDTKVLAYHAPHLMIRVACSKGTYIRSIAHDLGEILGCGAHLSELQRIRSGPFLLKDCLDGNLLNEGNVDVKSRLKLL
ncbi:MAG: tRNA pseudouridine(55) synthase TruB [Waddliaceae bacterium]|nr:tRNA pseudouridine(55) synthase TruB [Waddliaceae bacterium]